MNRLFALFIFNTTLFLSVFSPAFSQEKNTIISSQYQLYQNCSKVYNLCNQGNDNQANALADSIFDSNQLGYQLPYWGYLTSYKGSILHHGGNFFLSKSPGLKRSVDQATIQGQLIRSSLPGLQSGRPVTIQTSVNRGKHEYCLWHLAYY